MGTSIFDLVKVVTELQLKGPDGESDIPVKLKVQNVNVGAVKQKALEANAWLVQAGKANDPKSLLTAITSAEKAAAELAAAAIVGWDNDEYLGGSYSPEYCRDLLSKPQLEFVRKQVNEFIMNQTNFFR